MKGFAILTGFLSLIQAQSYIIGLGGQLDDNNCLTGAGYSWCESTQECIRIWETPCKDHYSNCNDCLTRQRNGENIACPNSCNDFIPPSCASWFDGCNTCMVQNGQPSACTMMMCFRTAEPHCQSFYTGDLQVNDICYRFCEDGSQGQIDRQTECPSGTQCMADPNLASMLVYDTCGARAKKCLTIKGH
jgi:hypothetical protein